MTVPAPDSENEFSKFVTQKLRYEIVPRTDEKAALALEMQKTSSISSEGSTDRETVRRGIRNQIIATCAVLLLSAACGMPIGFSAVLLPQLTNTNAENVTTEIAIDIEMGSWIASVHSLATPMGSLMSGPLADSIGRRTTLLLSIIPTFLGWSVLALAPSYPMLILGRFLCGFATGLLGGPAQVYIAETAEPNIRGLLIGAPLVTYSLGIFIVYALGSVLNWRTVAWCGNILPTLAALALICIPESPAWLLRNKKVERATRALTFLRGSEITAQKEVYEMEQRLKEEQNSAGGNEENIFELCCHREAIKPLVIVIVLCLLQMFSGTFVVVFYAIDIISDFGGDINTETAAICTALVRMICSLIFCVVLLIVRRRTIITISGIGSGVSCLVLSAFMYARVGEPKVSSDVIVAGACLFSYIAFNTALMIMPAIMIGELFPSKIRGRFAGTVFAMMNIALFGLTKAFPVIQAAIKMRGVFMLFALSSFLVSIFMFMFQPETKGRTLAEIEDYFKEEHWFWFKRNSKEHSNDWKNNDSNNNKNKKSDA